VDFFNQNVLILSGVRGDTRRYRTFHLLQQLRMAGVDSKLSHTTDPSLAELARTASVMILHRVPFDAYIAGLIQNLHARQGLVLGDIDDLIFEPEAFGWIDSPDFQDPVRAKLYREDMRRHRQTLQACDAILASTEYLAQAARTLGKPCHVHRNAASLELYYYSERASQQHRQQDGKIVIGYASGTPTHNTDFSLASPALQALLKTHPEVELRIIGPLVLDPGWNAFAGRIQRDPLVSWRALPSWLAHLDLNLAPLVLDNPFSQSKSEIKYMEAALVGVPTLASRTDAFAAAIRPGENGLLAGSEAEWQVQLERALAPDLRQALGQAACQDARQNDAPQVRARQAVELLNQVSASAGRPLRWEAHFDESLDPKSLWWDPALERRPTLTDMGLYTLRRRGAGTLALQAWAYARRWLARFIPYERPDKP
jgi:glycosyltransferase involved in cell wall biosynthesis